MNGGLGVVCFECFVGCRLDFALLWCVWLTWYGIWLFLSFTCLMRLGFILCLIVLLLVVLFLCFGVGFFGFVFVVYCNSVAIIYLVVMSCLYLFGWFAVACLLCLVLVLLFVLTCCLFRF